MITVTWTLIGIVIILIFALFCMLIAFACLQESKKAGWWEISWAEKDGLKREFVFWMLVGLMFWVMLYIALDAQGYIAIIAGYLPIRFTDHGIRIWY